MIDYSGKAQINLQQAVRDLDARIEELTERIAELEKPKAPVPPVPAAPVVQPVK